MNNNKVFLILGASSDLGLALVRKLNEDYTDSTFCLHYHSSSEALEALPFSNGNRSLLFQADLSSDTDVQVLLDDLAAKELSPTHIVHLCASKMMYTKLKDFDAERLDKNVRIQVYSFVRILKAFLPGMAKRKEYDKVVAVISSVASGKPPKSMLEYTAVKSMLLGVIKQLAADYEGKKVCINGVSPSMIETKFLSDLDPRLVEMAAEVSPENRNAKPEDIVPAIAFLLSEDSNYMNGVNLNVSNGSVII
ncbi:SDR family NAD(P)-dependent oxidoreductase [Butyrivibrio sp. FCS014]|uniref:SDR family NAD(P)-dependent oxidoreductase n=1 Tax=Butyrivibrio sp. FCS014 TaxID=1408304 RepID=UPI0004663969|nr:SDR family oxidoreductase [Butyrivibrio sp. FCS014]